MTAIAYQDFLRDGTWAPGFGSSPLDIAPLDNLVTPQLGSPWAATHGFSNRVLVRQFASASTPVDLVALLDIRHSHALSVRVAYGPDIELVPSTPILQYASSEFVTNMFFLLPARVTTNAIAFRLSSTNGATYSIGRAWAGPVYTPPSSIRRTWRTAVDDPGIVMRSRGNQGYSRVRRRTRRLMMELGHVPFAQAFGLPDNSVMDIQQLAYRIGTTSPVIILPRTHQAGGSLDLQAIHRIGMYCHLTRPIDIEHAGGDFYSARLEASELL